MRKFVFVGLILIAGACASNGWNDSTKGVFIRDCQNNLAGTTAAECSCWVEKIAERWSHENYTSNVDRDSAMSAESDAMLQACK